MKKIELTQSKYAFVSDEDYDRLSEFSWFIDSRNGYACRNITVSYRPAKQRKVFMHREVLCLPIITEKNRYVDHIDGNRLNNQRNNLRVATTKDNAGNRFNSTNSSGYKGVTWNKRSKKWNAQIKKDGKSINLGYFVEILNAATIYNNAAKEYYGEFAYLNTLPDNYVITETGKWDGKVKPRSISGYVGISKCKQTGKWTCKLTKNNKKYWLGRFERLEDAIEARENKIKEL